MNNSRNKITGWSYENWQIILVILIMLIIGIGLLIIGIGLYNYSQSIESIENNKGQCAKKRINCRFDCSNEYEREEMNLCLKKCDIVYDKCEYYAKMNK